MDAAKEGGDPNIISAPKINAPSEARPQYEPVTLPYCQAEHSHFNPAGTGCARIAEDQPVDARLDAPQSLTPFACRRYPGPMTEAEFTDYVVHARRRVAAELAQLERVDAVALDREDRALLDRTRNELLDLWASLSDEAIAAELEASEYARRELTPDEVRAIRTRQ